ncbi:MAG: HDOD domain-containing protein [Planctomycetota bacterium]|nr:HDOD domain-containing protein [Planctomycetota bacterium]
MISHTQPSGAIDLPALIDVARHMEPLPVSVTRLAGMVADERTSIGQFVEVIHYDPGLTARILQLANSAASASVQPVTTVKNAVSRLGMGVVLTFAVGTQVRRRLRQGIPEFGYSEGGLWHHSLASALGAEILSGYCKTTVPPETFTTALLHDIGKLVLCRYLRPEVLDLLRRALSEGRAGHLDAEREVLQLHHGEVGGLIAQHWNLPDSIVQGIVHHHTPELAESPSVCAVYLANRVAHEIGAGTNKHETDEARFARALDYMGLTPAGFEAACKTAGERLDEVVKRYE